MVTCWRAFWPARTLRCCDSITIWADIGVIFILFDLGLDYNFNKIKSTANTAIIAAVAEFTGIACLGFACAQLLGWSVTDSIFTGCMLTMSSTAVVSKTLGELNLLKKAFAPIAYRAVGVLFNHLLHHRHLLFAQLF